MEQKGEHERVLRKSLLVVKPMWLNWFKTEACLLEEQGNASKVQETSKGRKEILVTSEDLDKNEIT